MSDTEATLFMLDMDGSMVPDPDGDWVRAEVYHQLVERYERMAEKISAEASPK